MANKFILKSTLVLDILIHSQYTKHKTKPINIYPMIHYNPTNTSFICSLGTYMSNLAFKKFESSEKKTPILALLNFDKSTSGPYLGPLEVPKTPNDLRTLKYMAQGFQNGIKHFFIPKNTRDISILRKKPDFQNFHVRFLENLKLSKNGVF